MFIKTHKPILWILIVIAIMGWTVCSGDDAKASETTTEDMAYMFLEQAFPVFSSGTDVLDTWVDTMFPWGEKSEDQNEEMIVYDIPVSNDKIFQGYPDDEIVKEVMQPLTAAPDKIRNVRTQYNSSVIENFSYLQNLYSYDTGDVVRTPEDLNGQKFMEYDFTTDLSGEDPVVLLFHTHGSEGYVGCEEQGVIETAAYLKQILEEQYGIPVLHHKEIYDAQGVNGAYERMNEGVSKVLAENPSIQIAIDIHRDGIGGDGRLSTTVNGKETAQVMLVNGLCKLLDENGVMQTAYIAQNPYLEENLAFSFRMKMASDTMYEGWMRNMYLKAYRYSTHMLPKSLLLEVGAEGNTIEEAKNAMEPFAEVLVTVLTGNG